MKDCCDRQGREFIYYFTKILGVYICAENVKIILVIFFLIRKKFLLSLLADFHKTSPYVVTGSVDQTVKVWECR